MNSPINTQMQALRARWAALAPREKVMVGAAATVVGLAIVWLLFIAPALSTLRSAETQRRALDSQLQRMGTLQQQARTMQAQPKQSRDEALRQLEQSVQQRLGTSGRIVVAGDRVTVTLTNTSADALAQWLAQARTAAHSLPAEAHLVRNGSGAWEGNLVLTLPRS